MSQLPTITVDRTVGHYVSKIDVDWDGIAKFYETLPFEGKPPLGDCHIHFSGLKSGCEKYVEFGMHIPSSKMRGLSLIDPLAPKDTSVILFLGSWADAKEAPDRLSSVLRHELVHYAEVQKLGSISSSDRAMFLAWVKSKLWQWHIPKLLRLLTAFFCSFGVTWLIGKLAEARFSMLPVLLSTLFVGGCWLFATKKADRVKCSAAQRRAFALYVDSDREKSARSYEDGDGSLLVVVEGVRNHEKVGQHKVYGRRSVNREVDALHRKMSLTPQGAWQA